MAEIVLNEIKEKIGELSWEEQLWLLEHLAHLVRERSSQEHSKNLKTWKGRRVVTEDDLKHMDCPLPPEPEWEKEWNK